MQATDPVSWVRIMDGPDEDGDWFDACFFCAIVATDPSMRTEVVGPMPNDLLPGESVHCELCDVLIAKGPSP